MDLLFQRFKKREKMTYHSKLQLGNDIAFKKTTIEQLIRQFDDSFSLSQPKQAEITNHDQSSNMEWLDYEQDDNQQESLINELHGEIEQLKAELQQSHDETAHLKAELQQANDEIVHLKAEIENAQSLPLFDPNDEYTYPPELDECFKIWHEIYVNNTISPHITEHSARFNYAVKKLGITFDSDARKKRLTIVTTPKAKKDKTRK